MILLDTHTWIWAHSATKLLSDNVKRLIKKTQTDQRAIASISIWEFAMMVTKGHINVKINPKRWLNDAIGNSGLRVIELTPEIAMESCNLPGSFHKDPADRIIVATARTHNLTLLTKDRKIIEYPHVQAVW
ncbi:MAG: type II toxin-antitoxin system VapC family toxin [Dissulfuribacterales bacterium]